MRAPLPCLLITLAAAPVGAQSKLHDGPATMPNPIFSALGDVNADGRADYAVLAEAGFAASPGRVEVRSGADGSVLFDVSGSAPGDNFGLTLAAAGDMNGDAIPDLLVGAPFSDAGGLDTGYVRVISGAGGATLLHVAGTIPGARFGSAVCSVAHANGDGVRDFAVATNAIGSAAGKVSVLSGTDGSVVQSWTGSAGQGFGLSLASPDDLDGDGISDVAIVAYLDPLDTRVYSVATGALIRAQQHGAGQVAAAGDLDADGTQDLLVLANQSSDGTGRVLSGATGLTLLDFGHFGDFFFGPWGSSVDVLGDVTGDGRPDYVMGEVGADELDGSASVFSGADGSLLYKVNEWTDVNLGSNGDGPTTFGFRVASLADVNGDGAPDFAASSPGHLPVYSGAINAFVPLMLGWVVFDSPDLFCSSTLKPGSELGLRVQPLDPGQFVYLLAGLSQVSLPFKGGTLVPDPQLVVGPLRADVTGKLVLATHWPAGVPAGMTLFLQAWSPEPAAPAGWLATNGSKGTVPP